MTTQRIKVRASTGKSRRAADYSHVMRVYVFVGENQRVAKYAGYIQLGPQWCDSS